MAFEELLIQCTSACEVQKLTPQGEVCPEVWEGRINELLFVECSTAIDSAWMLDLSNWTANFVTSGFTGRRTLKGIGDFQKVAVNAVDLGDSCGLASIVGAPITYEVKFKQLIIEKESGDFKTHVFYDELQKGAIKNYKVFMRGCEDGDMLYPIGVTALTDFNFVVPENNNEASYFNIALQWKQKGVPMPIRIPGLSTVIGA